MSSFVHINNKKKNILTFEKDPTQGLFDATLTAEAQYSINFPRSSGKASIIMGATAFYLLMLQKYINDSEIKKISPELRKNFTRVSTNNMKKIRLNECAYDYSVDYVTFDTSNMIDIYKNLMKKHNMKSCLSSLKKYLSDY